MNATDTLSSRARTLDTPLAHRALVHPPVDPALVELQLRCLGERTVLARRGTFEIRALPGTIERELRIELGRLREQRARLMGRGTGRPADLDEVELQGIHIVVWCTEKASIAAAACILDPRAPTERAHHADGRLDSRLGTVDVARSFVAVGFAESDAAVALLRGIDAWMTARRRMEAAE